MADSVSLADVAASLGLPVFPCGPNKRPLTGHGFHDALRGDGARELFARPAAVMIGVPTGAASGYVGVDVDIKDGRRGREWLDANAHRLPTTRTHKTRSGGLHLIFLAPLGVDIRNSASLVAEGVDIRGTGGYLIWPPSPGYSVADSAPPAEMPDWLIEACMRRPKPEPVPYTAPVLPIAGEGTPYGLRALANECALIRGAAHGHKHHTLNKAAYSIGGLVAAGQVAEGLAFSALAEALQDMHARQPCDDLRHAEKTLRQAFQEGIAAPRAVPERPAPEPVRLFEARAEAGTGQEQPEAEQQEEGARTGRRSRFRTLSIDDVMALPPPEWLVTGVLTCGGYAGLYGPPGSLKSFTVLGMAMAVAYGKDWAGRTTKQMGVLYVAGEGARGIGKRIRAWQQHHGMGGVDAPFRLLCDGVNLTSPEDTAELIMATMEAAEMEGCPIGLVVIDTVARSMVGADENSATDMGRFNEAVAQIIRQVDGCPNVLAVHHTGKDTDRGARGSNSFLGAVDTMLRVSRSDDFLTLKVEKQKDDEDGFDIHLRKVGIREPDADPDSKPYSLVVVEAEGPNPAAKADGLPDVAHQALKALKEALAKGAIRVTHRDIPPVTPVVTLFDWRREFTQRCTADTPEAKRQAWGRGHKLLIKRGIAVVISDYAWLVE